MEKEAEQLKLNALNIKSILTSGSKKLNKIKFKKTNLDRTTIVRKNRRMKEKVLESAKETRKNVGAGAKNLASKVIASKPGKFLQLLLLGVIVNNIDKILKFFKGDPFKNITDRFNNIGKTFTNLFDNIVGFFNPKSPEIKIPDGLNDENSKKLEKVNEELKNVKKETNKLNEFFKSIKEKYKEFKNKITNNKDTSSNLESLKSSSKKTKKNIDSMTIGNIFNNNPFGGKTFAESMNVLDGNKKVKVESLNKEVKNLSTETKTKTKTVVITKTVLMGTK